MFGASTTQIKNILGLSAVGLLGVFVSFWAQQVITTAARESAALAFTEDAAGWVYGLEAQMLSASNSVKAIGDLYAASKEVDRDEFRIFGARALSEATGLQALEWLPKTSPENASDLQEQTRAEGIPDYALHSIGSDTLNKPGQGFSHHFPVHFVEPLRSNRVALGADLTSESTRAEAMQRAIKTGKFSLSAGIRLIQEGGESQGLLGFWPILDYGNRPRVLHGFAAGVWRVNDLVSAVARDIRHDSSQWRITVRDVTTPAQPQQLYSSATGTAAGVTTMQRKINVGGRQWAIEISPLNPINADTSQATLVLFAGLAFTALLLIYFSSILNRSRTVSRLVDERTQELNDALASLEATARQRESARAELAQKAAALEASNADLERFAYIASHDLKEPLRTISSYVQLLERDLDEQFKGQLDAESRESMAFISDGTKRMQQLIEDLLDYSHVGGNQLKLGKLDLLATTQASVDALSDLIERNHATVEIRQLPELSGDQSLLSLLMQNLVSNGIKFRDPDRNPRVTISSEKKGKFWEICVADNGIGIEEKNLQKVFKLFQRLHTRSEFEGTGLGLAICQRIVQRHGGEIWVTSEPGAGSQFRFTLPAE